MTAAIAPLEPTTRLLTLDEPFVLECGTALPRLEIAFETYGELDPAGDNAVYVCHALTGNAHASSWGGPAGGSQGWWDGLIGPRRPLDTSRHFIVCANLLGGCSGTTGPVNINPTTGNIYGMEFPQVTTRDMVRVQKRLLDELGVKRLQLVIGGSLGGMQVWQWLVDFPDFVEAGVPIAGTPQGSPWMIALNQVARQAIFNDPAWQGGRFNGSGPDAGLALARMIATISYRSDRQFSERFSREPVPPTVGGLHDPDDRFQVESYLRHQGHKLAERFDARAYVYLTRAMDHHDVAHGFDDLDAALGRIRSRVLAVGIDSDVLYYPHELTGAVERLRETGVSAWYRELRSPYGHDAFLIEYDQLNEIVGAFLNGGRP